MTNVMQMAVAEKCYPVNSRQSEAEILSMQLEFEHSNCCCVNWCCTARPLGPGHPTNNKVVLYVNLFGCPGKRLSTYPNVGPCTCFGGESTNGESAPIKQLPYQLAGTISPAVWTRFVNHLLQAQESVMPSTCLCCLMHVPFLGTHTTTLCYLAKGQQGVLGEMYKVVEAYKPFFFQHGLVVNMGTGMDVGGSKHGQKYPVHFVSVEKVE